MNMRYEKTDDADLLLSVFMRNDIEAEEDEFSAGHTELLKGYLAYDDDQGGKLIGAVALARRLDRTVINGIAVDEAYRRSGVASRLLELILEEARARQLDTIWIVARAPWFFETQGFDYIEDLLVPPGLFDCMACPQYKKTCFPRMMQLKL